MSWSKGSTNMNPAIRKLHEAQLRKDLPEFRAGDTIRVNVRLKEGEGEKEKERLQAFEGVVISKKGRASSATFTVRRVSFGVGIERIFPLRPASGNVSRTTQCSGSWNRCCARSPKGRALRADSVRKSPLSPHPSVR